MLIDAVRFAKQKNRNITSKGVVDSKTKYQIKKSNIN